MRIVSLFAGCGGLDLGFEKAGFDIIWANEYDKSIHATYRYNHPNTYLCTSDVRELSASDIPDCDGIIGGPPCQAWSEGGNRRGIEDERGQLFLDYIRIVSEKKPKFFLIENVQGILEDKHSTALQGFLDMLKFAGYNIVYELLNAADYKVPQDRFRVFFIGIRKDLNIKYSFPDAACTTPITLRQAIGDIVEAPRYYSKDSVMSDHPNRSNHDVYAGAYDQKYMSRNRVRSWDEPSFTMQAQARNAPQHPQAPKMSYLSANERCFVKGQEQLYRRLSIRECARIQTFPDNFKFIYSDVKDGYKMVGNAVPPRLAWFLACQIKAAFDTGNHARNTNLQQAAPLISGITVAKIANQYKKLEIIQCNVLPDLDKIDISDNVLVALVPASRESCYDNTDIAFYYTGRHFPAIALDKLRYLMPYRKGKGIRDLYYIKGIRVGSKHEIDPMAAPNDLRLLFELVFVKQLLPDYMPIHLNIWHTYSFNKLGLIMKLEEKY